jgi:hypothetical protein
MGPVSKRVTLHQAREACQEETLQLFGAICKLWRKISNHHNLFYQIQNALAFNWVTCSHLALCWAMELDNGKEYFLNSDYRGHHWKDVKNLYSSFLTSGGKACHSVLLLFCNCKKVTPLLFHIMSLFRNFVFFTF